MADKNLTLEAAELLKAQAEAVAAEQALKQHRLDRKLKKIQIQKEAVAAEQAAFNLEQEVSQLRWNEALDWATFGTLKFRTDVTDGSVGAFRTNLRAFTHLYPGDPLRIEFFSPGGSILAGLDMFDDIRRASDAGHHVTTVITGYAASMAGVLVQAGDHRVIGKHSYLHLHEGSGWSVGKVSSQKDELQFLETLTRQMCKIYADRAARVGGTLTADELYSMIERRELWLSAEEALEYRFVDEIA